MKRLVLHIYILFMALTTMACQSNEVEATPSDKSAITMNITINGKTVLNAGDGSVRITLSSGSTTGIKQTLADRKASTRKYSLDGRKLKQTPSKGVYIGNGKKIIKK